MTLPTFPSLAGQAFSVHKKPRWDTAIAIHASGREARANRYTNPLWDFELTFDGLDMSSTGIYGDLGALSMQTLAGFYCEVQGRYGAFLYVDPTDNSVTRQLLGVGDGVTKQFTFVRTLGGFTEPVGAITTLTAVYLRERLQASGWTASANTLTFTTAPGAGVAVTADFSFAYVCRFSEDVEDFEEFMSLLSLCKTMTFQSLRIPIPGPIWITVRQILTGSGPWIVPDTWNNANNRIDAVGAGGGGGYTGGNGGGGAAYTFDVNLSFTPGASIPVTVGVGGAGGYAGLTPGQDGTETFFNSGHGFTFGVVYAAPGHGGSGSGGIASDCFPVGNAEQGGTGGANSFVALGAQGYGGGAGGGAGGPDGPGANGGTSRAPAYHLPAFDAGAGGGGSDGGSPGGNSWYTGTIGTGGVTDGVTTGGDGGTATGGPGTTGLPAHLWWFASTWWGPSGGGGGGGSAIYPGGGAGGPGGAGAGIITGFGGGGGAGDPGGQGANGGVVITWTYLSN